MARQKRKAGKPENKRPAWFGAWQAISERARLALVAASLLVVAVAFMAPVVFSSSELVGGDTVQWTAMAQSLMEAEEATGDKPLWATRPFGGMPGFMISYGNAVPQIDEVARVARRLFWPTSHLLILFAGMYLLVFFLVRDRLSAALAAVAYGLTTYLPVILVAGHNSKFVALAFAPWLLLAFANAIRRPRLLSGLLFAIALAVHIRAGHVQITYYALWVIGIWWIGEGISAVREGRSSSFVKATLWLGLGSALALLMVAQPYLAQWEFKRYTIRGAAAGGAAGGLAWDYAMGWSQGAGELLTLLVADAYGGSALYWGPKIFTGGPHYVGGIVLALAIFAAFRVKTVAARSLSIAAVLIVLFSLGENFALLNRALFEYFPLFDAFRVPETWLSALAMVLAILAAMGLREASRPDRTSADEGGTLKTLGVTFGGVAGFVLILLVLGDAALSFERPNEAEQLAAQITAQRPDLSARDPQVVDFLNQEVTRRKTDRKAAFSADAKRTLFILLLAGLLLFLVHRRRIPGWAAQAALVLLVAIDLGGVGRRYLNADVLTPERQVDNTVPEYPFDEFIKARVAEEGGEGHFRTLSLERVPTELARPAYHYQTLSGYHGAKLRRYQDFLDQMLFDPASGQLSESALAVMNTRYVVARRPPGTMNAVFPDDVTGFTVFENQAVLPRAWFVERVEHIPDAYDQWARFHEPDFNPAVDAFTEVPLDLAPATIDSSSVADARLTSFLDDEIQFEVQTDAERLLVISEVFYPAGWSADIGGEPAEIVAADYLVRGVVVPAGEHTLTMRFAPASHATGLWIAWASTLLVYGGVVVLLILQARGTPSREDSV